jgi:hypothetical protein
MDIYRLLPKDQYDAALSANSPSSANPFATIADIPSSVNIYNSDGLLTGSRIVNADGNSLDFVNVTTFSLAAANIDLRSSNNTTIYFNNFRLRESVSGNYFNIVANGSLSATHTATFQNASGTVAYLSDITGDGIYSGSGIVPTTTVATLTDNITFTGGQFNIKGGGNDQTTIALSVVNSLSENLLTVNNDATNISYSTPTIQIGLATTGATIKIGDYGGFGAYHTGSYPGMHFRSKNGAFWFFNDTYGGIGANTIYFTPNPTTGATLRAVSTIISDTNTDFSILHNANDTADKFNLQTNNALSVATDRIKIGNFAANVDINIVNVNSLTIGTTSNPSLVTVNGDVETLTNTKGFIVLDRTDGNRYRIYTDGGVLNTELA